jgi:hypothetical protein
MIPPASSIARANAFIGSLSRRQLTSINHLDIVMGTRGMTAFGQMLLGSVASRVVHFAAVPVTLVK